MTSQLIPSPLRKDDEFSPALEKLFPLLGEKEAVSLSALLEDYVRATETEDEKFATLLERIHVTYIKQIAELRRMACLRTIAKRRASKMYAAKKTT